MSQPRHRSPAQNITIGDTTFLTLASFAAMVHRPVGVVRRWARLPENPLPVTRPPSAVAGTAAQVQYVEQAAAITWLKSHASDADKPRKAGRPPRNRAKR
jgi:hypothetical protein